jgi:hypothetical protein
VIEKVIMYMSEKTHIEQRERERARERERERDGKRERERDREHDMKFWLTLRAYMLKEENSVPT